MKKILLLCLSLLLFISCIPQKEGSYVIPTQKLTFPMLYSLDSSVYLCKQYTLVYTERTNSKYKKRDVCSCVTIPIDILGKEITIFSNPTRIGDNTIIVWDKNFTAKYILPLFEEENDRKTIEYTLNHSTDSTFKNIIDYNNKVIVNDKMYYYPINIKTGISVLISDYEWFKSVVPRSSWIYESSCFDDEKGMWVSLFIPLLDNN